MPESLRFSRRRPGTEYQFLLPPARQPDGDAVPDQPEIVGNLAAKCDLFNWRKPLVAVGGIRPQIRGAVLEGLEHELFGEFGMAALGVLEPEFVPGAGRENEPFEECHGLVGIHLERDLAAVLCRQDRLGDGLVEAQIQIHVGALHRAEPPGIGNFLLRQPRVSRELQPDV